MHAGVSPLQLFQGINLLPKIDSGACGGYPVVAG